MTFYVQVGNTNVYVPAQFLLDSQGNPVVDPNTSRAQNTPIYADSSGQSALSNPNGYLIVPANYSLAGAIAYGQQLAQMASTTDAGDAGLAVFGGMAAAFWYGPQDLQRSYVDNNGNQIVGGAFVAAFQDAASFNYGVVGASAGFSLLDLQIAGGVKALFSTNQEPQGLFGNAQTNLNSMSLGYSYGSPSATLGDLSIPDGTYTDPTTGATYGFNTDPSGSFVATLSNASQQSAGNAPVSGQANFSPAGVLVSATVTYGDGASAQLDVSAGVTTGSLSYGSQPTGSFVESIASDGNQGYTINNDAVAAPASTAGQLSYQGNGVWSVGQWTTNQGAVDQLIVTDTGDPNQPTSAGITDSGSNGVLNIPNGSNFLAEANGSFQDTINNAQLAISDGMVASLIGTSDLLSVTGNNAIGTLSDNSGSTAAIDGIGNTVNSNGNAVQVADNSSAAVDGSSNAITEGRSAAVDVEGNGNAVNMADNSGSTANVTGTDNQVNANNDGVSVGASSTATVDGNNNTIGALAGDTVNVSGSGDGITLDGTAVSQVNIFSGVNDVVTADLANIWMNDGTSATIEGDGNSAAGVDVVMTDDGTDDIDYVTTGTYITIAGADDTAYAQGDDTVVSSASGTVVVVEEGANNYAQASDATLWVDSGASATFSGDNNLVQAGLGTTVGLSGSDNEVFVSGVGLSNVNIFSGEDDVTAYGASIWMNNDTSATVDGDGNSVNSSNGNTIGFSGTSDNAYVTDGTVVLNTASTSVTVHGDSDTVDGANGSTIGFDGGFNGNTDNAYVSDSAIYLDNSDTSVTVIGNSDVVNAQNGATIGFDGGGGAGNTDNVYVSDSAVYLDTASTSVTIFGDDDNEHGTNGSTVGFSGGTADNAYVSDSTINLDTSATSVTVFGDDDNAYGVNGSTIGFWGGTADNAYVSDSTINLDTSATSVTVFGDDDNAHGADGSTIGFWGGTADNAYGNNLSVNLDTSSTSVTVYGNDDYARSVDGSVVGFYGGSDDDAEVTGGTINVDNASTSVTVIGSDNRINADNGGTVSLADNVGGDIIDASNAIINEGPNDDVVYVFGSYDTVYAYASDITDIDGAWYDGTTFEGYGGSSGYGGSGSSWGSSGLASGAASNMSAVTQFDLDHGYTVAATAAQAAQARAQLAITAGADPETSSASAIAYNGIQWSGDVVTWSFAAASSSSASPVSASIQAQYQGVIEQALQTWASASGLTFEQVSDSASSDIRIGWGDFDTAASGTAGYTSAATTAGQPQSILIRLEDPSEDALLAGSDGDLTYSGTDTTLYQLALHEIGHALGLAESSDPGSVMYPILGSSNLSLDANDISGIQSIYNATSLPATSSSAPQMIQAMATFGAPSLAATALVLPAVATTASPTLSTNPVH